MQRYALRINPITPQSLQTSFHRSSDPILREFVSYFEPKMRLLASQPRIRKVTFT